MASDTTESQLLVLNHLTAPGYPVVWAVRMSMSIPLVSEGIISQVRQVAEGAASVNEKLDRTRQELKTEIQEARQEILTALKFSYAELGKRLTTLERESLELKHRVEKIEGHSIS